MFLTKIVQKNWEVGKNERSNLESGPAGGAVRAHSRVAVRSAPTRWLSRTEEERGRRRADNVFKEDGSSENRDKMEEVEKAPL